MCAPAPTPTPHPHSAPDPRPHPRPILSALIYAMIYIILAIAVVVTILVLRRIEGFTINRDQRIRVCVYHYTPWCPACKMMSPRWEAVKQSLNGSGIKFIDNDETQNPTPGITGYPSFTLIDVNGKRLVRTGVCSPDDLLVWITSPTNFEYTPTGYSR